MTHYTYDFFPRRHETALAFHGLLTAVLLWQLRGPRSRVLWIVSLFGIVEGIQVFVCQMASNWRSVTAPRFAGVCDSYSGLPLYGWGLIAMAFLAAYVHDKKGTHRGLD